MKLASGRASAKLILLGEHFVLPWTDSRGETHAGLSAIALPLPAFQTDVMIEPGNGNPLVCEPRLDQLDPSEASRAQALMDEVVRKIAPIFGCDLKTRSLRVSSSSNFPISRGFGSSAAFSIALARAFQDLTKARDNDVDLKAVAATIENVFHGKSSGLDTSVILEGRPVLFSGGRVLKTLTIQSIDCVVVDCGPRANCASLVSQTMQLRRDQPERWRELGARVGKLVETCALSLADASAWDATARCLGESQAILEEIGLATSESRRMLEIGLKSGALAGKISGAGAGGALFFATRPGDGASLSRKLADAGLEVLTVREAEGFHG